GKVGGRWGRPVALTIAGSDSGGGAGIQADLKTFQALGVYGASAITAITAQNTLGVRSVHEIPTDVIAAQIDAVAEDLGVDGLKTGMLSSGEIISTVAARVRHWDLAGKLWWIRLWLPRAATDCCARTLSRPWSTICCPWQRY